MPWSRSACAGVAWHVVVEPHDGVTLGLVPAFAALTLFVSAYMIVSARERIRPSEWAAATFIVLFGTSQALSAWIAMSQGAVRDETAYNMYMHFTYLTLPGLNRRRFNEYGEKAFAAARRNGTPLSVIMTDIDRFKYINDKFGHAAGDRALAHFAKLMTENRRGEDVIARVGGVESPRRPLQRWCGGALIRWNWKRSVPPAMWTMRLA